MLPTLPDIFSESDKVSPDTLANLGLLRRLAGEWQADKGVDVNPKAKGPERRAGPGSACGWPCRIGR